MLRYFIFESGMKRKNISGAGHTGRHLINQSVKGTSGWYHPKQLVAISKPRSRTTQMKKIGFIGLGTMGTHFATNLIKAGAEITVHDIRRDNADTHLSAGAKWADTPRELAAGSELIMTSLP